MRKADTALVRIFGRQRLREFSGAAADALTALRDGRDPQAEMPLHRAALILLEAAGMIHDAGQGEWDLTERGREALKRLLA